MNKELVSIVLPTYNGEQYLSEAIRSVLNQTYKNIELIIVDDCSTDNSLKIASDFAKNDKRIKIIHNKTNLKLPESLNVGFRKAKGEYYTWTSDDNKYDPKAIETMVNFLKKFKNYSIVCSNFRKIDEKGNELPVCKLNPSPQNMMLGNQVGCCFLYDAQCAKEVGEYDKNKFLIEDYDFWLRYMLKYGEILHIDEVLYTYRLHSKSLTGTRLNEILEKTQLKIKEYLPKFKKKWKNIKFKTNETTLLQQIFSVKNEGRKKVVRIFGLKIKLKRKKKKEVNYLKYYNQAKKWIANSTVGGGNGIIVATGQPKVIYPEVTGYYIPTLLRFGERDRALSFGKYLLTIQNQDGSWNEPSGKFPYVFDTGQILKGLAALVQNNLDENEKFKEALIKGADYILSMQREDGSIATFDYSCWKLPFNKSVPEAIHIYCLEPLRFVGKITNNPKYENCIQNALKFYLAQENLTDFTTLSHFNAYIIEGLIDIGETKRAKRAMDLISLHQKEDGSVSAYSNKDFVCSTGLLQYAICWYKLGDIEKGDKAFNYVCNLQNKSGGFYGSYTVGLDKANYFENSEISWAVKYFLDAIYFGQISKYQQLHNMFIDEIDADDERYTTVEHEIDDAKYKKILDLGCGKARYTKRLTKKFKDKEFHLVDLSEKALSFCKTGHTKKQGTILNIPYRDKVFDFCFITEALEHCIDLKNALKEISRILNDNGKLVIIDKEVGGGGT